MLIFFLFATVYVAGFFILAALIVLETELCPHSIREMLAKRHVPVPLTPQEEETKVDLRAARSLRMKNFHVGDHRHHH